MFVCYDSHFVFHVVDVMFTDVRLINQVTVK